MLSGACYSCRIEISSFYPAHGVVAVRSVPRATALRVRCGVTPDDNLARRFPPCMRTYAGVGLCGTGGCEQQLMCWSSAGPFVLWAPMGRHPRHGLSQTSASLASLARPIRQFLSRWWGGHSFQLASSYMSDRMIPGRTRRRPGFYCLSCLSQCACERRVQVALARTSFRLLANFAVTRYWS